MKNKKFLLFILPLFFSGCTPPNSMVTSGESQLAIRQVQTREYERVNVNQAIRASIATLQDLDFILDKVDAKLGTISASKYKNDYSVKMTVTVREKGTETMIVRANATYGHLTVVEPQCYQDFFTMLDKSLFLVKNGVD